MTYRLLRKREIGRVRKVSVEKGEEDRYREKENKNNSSAKFRSPRLLSVAFLS